MDTHSKKRASLRDWRGEEFREDSRTPRQPALSQRAQANRLARRLSPEELAPLTRIVKSSITCVPPCPTIT